MVFFVPGGLNRRGFQQSQLPRGLCNDNNKKQRST